MKEVMPRASRPGTATSNRRSHSTDTGRQPNQSLAAEPVAHERRGDNSRCQPSHHHPEACRHASVPPRHGGVGRRAMLASAALLAPPLLAQATARAAEAASEPTWKLALQLPSLQETQRQATSGRCTAALDPVLAAAFTRAVYDAVLDLEEVAPEELQQEIFRLRDQEYRYYYQTHQDRLPRVLDVSDQSGGLSNPSYFNFLYYILWKVAARQVRDDWQRSQLQQRAARNLLLAVAPEALQQVSPHPGASRATEQALAASLDLLLARLQTGGYCCQYQVAWGYSGGGLPRDWFQERVGVVGQAPTNDAPAPGMSFQLRVHQPADIDGSVALRAEEDGFWSAALPCMVSELLEEAGLQVASRDEFFFQDEWGGPRGWTDRVLLVLGDPLQRVEVPWEPSTLVLSWQLEG